MDVRPAPANWWTSDHLAVFEASAAFTGVIIIISAPNSARLNPIVPATGAAQQNFFTSDVGNHHSKPKRDLAPSGRDRLQCLGWQFPEP